MVHILMCQGIHWAPLDVFACFGLHAGGPDLDPAALQADYQHTLIPHLFKRNIGIADTQERDVPTWAHGNAAWDIFGHLDAVELPSMQGR